ncbi:MAG: hypothetical protein INR69_04080 [Mucilaginibacter polytrichastri]|nr:hypothetical protein [Mucilaginibacter polytrichastri]
MKNLVIIAASVCLWKLLPFNIVALSVAALLLCYTAFQAPVFRLKTDSPLGIPAFLLLLFSVNIFQYIVNDLATLSPPYHSVWIKVPAYSAIALCFALNAYLSRKNRIDPVTPN